MEGELDSLFEVDMELELIQIDRYRAMFSILRHLFIHSKLIEKTWNLIWAEND